VQAYDGMIHETKSFLLFINIFNKVVAIQSLALWALWAEHFAETNLYWVRTPRIRILNSNIQACIVVEITALIWTDGLTDMARSPQLVILIKNTFTLQVRKRFLLLVAYFPTNTIYRFTLQVTDIIKRIKSCIIIKDINKTYYLLALEIK